jgi:hypothetical protein
VIKDKEKRELLAPHIDNLLKTCSLKCNVAHNVYLNQNDVRVEDVFQLYKSIFHCIMDLFECGLGKSASVKSIKDLFYNLLLVMTDARILAYPDGDNLIKAINLVTLRLLECSSQTACYCALIRLLSECCDQQDNLSEKYRELVMKCIWRQIRRLSPQQQHSSSGSSTIQQFHNSDDLVKQIDTCQVFAEIHAFLTAYPTSSWQGKPNDLPLRTVKTLVYHLAKAKRNQVLDDLRMLDLPEDAEIKTYVGKLMRNGFQLNSASNQSNMSQFNTSSSNASFGFNNGGSKLTSNLVSPTQSRQDLVKSQFAAAIKKVSVPEQSREGLYELYELRRAYPEVDLSRFFRNASQLQSFIEENLKRIEEEKNSNFSTKSPSTSSTSSTSSSNANIKQSKLSPPEYRQPVAQPSGARKFDDVMRTIADWKSKTQLNDDNQENLRSGNVSAGTNLNRMTSGSNGGLFQGSTNTNLRLFGDDADGVLKAEKYQEIVKDLKKKYTRSRTEVFYLNFFYYSLS